MFALQSLRRIPVLASLFSVLVLFAPAAAQDELDPEAGLNLQKGLDLYQRERFDEARDAFRASLDVQRHAQVALYLGLTYARLGDPERASRYLNRALRWTPPLAAQERQQAESVLEWAQRADPDERWTPAPERVEVSKKSDGAVPPPASSGGGRTITTREEESDRDVGHPEPALLPELLGKVRVVNPYPDSPPSPPEDPKADLTGSWTSDDGSHYFLRQVGERVYWYGESPDGGSAFANVFCGKRSGNRITGEWIDVPRGGAMNVGWLEIEVLPDGTLRKLTSSIDYGASTWKR